MNRIADRVILLVLTFVVGFMCNGAQCIYVVLAGIIYSGLCYSYGKNIVWKIINGLLLISVTLIGDYTPVLMLMAYEWALDYFYENKKYIYIILGALAVYTVVNLAAGFNRSFFAADNTVAIVLLFLGIFIAIYLAYETEGYNSLKGKNLKLRDDNEEFRKYMIDRQDDEITMATLRERNRIAREIHDNVGHMLSRSIVQLGAVRTIYGDGELKDLLKDINITLNESMTTIRESVHNLHNSSVNLKKALEDIIKDNNEYETDFEYSIRNDMNQNIKYAFIAITTEAYENVKKHSDCSRINISICEHPGFYQYVFKDNGSRKNIKNTGIGLHNMVSRLEELNGHIDFTYDNGFKIFGTVPKEAGK